MNIIKPLLFFTAAAMLLAGCAAPHPVIWEYKEVQTIAAVNNLAGQGWLLVSSHAFDPGDNGTRYVMKHPKPPVSARAEGRMRLIAKEIVFSGKNYNNEADFGTNTGNFGTGDFTIEFWIKQPSDATQAYALLEKRTQCYPTPNLWSIRIGGQNLTPRPAPGLLDLELWNDDTTAHVLFAANKPINDGAYHHAAFTRQGRTYSIYIDGDLDTNTTAPGIINLNNSAMLMAGQSVCVGGGGDPSVPFEGALDKLDLFNRALSPREIAAICRAGRDGE